MISIGTDLVDVDRFRAVLGRTPSIVQRLFTSAEQAYAALKSDPTERLAARFAAKEAVFKALGLGLGAMAFREIEVDRAESGEPSLVLHGAAAEAARRKGVGRWVLTMSHTGHLASATAVALMSPSSEVASTPAWAWRLPAGARITDLVPQPSSDLVALLEGASGSVRLVTAADVQAWLPERPVEANKWQTAVCLVAGSPGMSGAAVLSSGGALRAGAGYVRLCTPGGLAEGTPVEVVQASTAFDGWSEGVLEDLDRFSALVVGNGLGTDDETVAEVRRVVGQARLPTVVDADAITALGPSAAEILGSRSSYDEPTVVFTPHDGEFARLAGGPPGADRIGAARELASHLGAVVLLKGSLTTVAHPDGRVLLSNTGDSRLATAGTGDVLAGVIGALCARGLDVWRAAAAGAFIHGLSGCVGWRHGLVASDLLTTLPLVLEGLTELEPT